MECPCGALFPWLSILAPIVHRLGSLILSQGNRVQLSVGVREDDKNFLVEMPEMQVQGRHSGKKSPAMRELRCENAEELAEEFLNEAVAGSQNGTRYVTA